MSIFLQVHYCNSIFFWEFAHISHRKDPKQKSPNEISDLGVNKWKVLTDTAWRIGAKGLESTFLKVLCNPHPFLFFSFVIL